MYKKIWYNIFVDDSKIITFTKYNIDYASNEFHCESKFYWSS